MSRTCKAVVKPAFHQEGRKRSPDTIPKGERKERACSRLISPDEQISLSSSGEVGGKKKKISSLRRSPPGSP
jgi:hypothetical protein